MTRRSLRKRAEILGPSPFVTELGDGRTRASQRRDNRFSTTQDISGSSELCLPSHLSISAFGSIDPSQSALEWSPV